MRVIEIPGKIRQLGVTAWLQGNVIAIEVAYSPDGKTIVTGGQDGTVRFWDADSGELLKGWNWKVGPIKAVAFSPDGFTCVAAGGDDEGRIVVWDLDND